MFLSRLVPQKFGFRLFFMTLVAGLTPIVIFAFLIENYGKAFRPEIDRTIRQAYEEEWTHSEALLKKIAEMSIKQKALDVASQLDLVLQSHQYMTLSDLRNDPGFRALAVQTVGTTGYTAVHEAQTGVIRFHIDRTLEDKNPSALERSNPALWRIIKKTLGGGEGSGYYRWEDNGGTKREKYLYIAPLHQKTADDVLFAVTVSADVDEFLASIKDAETIHRTTAGYLTGVADNLFRSFRRMGLLYMGIGIWIISCLAAITGIYFSRSVTRLREATQKINNGDLDVLVKPSMSGEMKDLTEDFNRMVLTLARTTVSRDLLEESERHLIDANAELQREITIRKLVEKTLAAEREQLAVTLSSIGDGVVTVDREGKVLLLNVTAQKLTGCNSDDARGRSVADVLRIVDEKSRRVLKDPVAPIIGKGDSIDFPDSYILIGKEGIERIVALSGAPIRDHENIVMGAVVVFRDVTEKRKLEEELLTVRKLESVGTLAGGIAHDFNNLLAVILGNVSFAKMLIEKNSQAYQRLLDAETATMKGKDLTYRLLTFSRGGEPLRKVTSIDRIVEDSTSLSLSGSNVKASFSFPDDLRRVEIDEGQIRQVIHNIAVNAKEAMPEGGSITVTARNMTLGAESPIPLPEGDYVMISLTDSGAGISDEDLPRIFDPYFTTKEMGNVKGMGLGLAICFSIVKNHRGHIEAKSQVGSGTTIYVYLPAYREPEKVVAIPTKTGKTGGPYRILYMDDEDDLRSIVGRMLNHSGHDVSFARDGAEAIEEYRKALALKKPFDVVIMDLTVPGGMGGVEAVRRLRDEDPDIRAIVASGYADDTIMNDFRAYGFRGAIAKPYELEALLRVIETVATDVPPVRAEGARDLV